MIVLHGIMLLIALIATPLLIVLCASRRRDLAAVAAATGILSVVLASVAAITLHVTGIPITGQSLAVAHLVLFCLTAAVAVLRRPALRLQLEPDERRWLLPGVAMLLIIIFPYTYFTGIDTYKWQDLATSVRVEAALPWVVHPLSLLGFTPRSYPSAYPIELATIQILGNLGVDGGFFVASIFVALLGTASAYWLALRCFAPRIAIAFALFYAMSPVFIRYTHWATGRGLFLALFPAFLALLLARTRMRACSGALAVGALLCLSHKVGMVAAPLLILLAVLSALLPHRSNRTGIALCCVLPLLAAAAIVTPFALPFPAGQAAGLVRYSITRFAWMVPLAAVGLLGPRDFLGDRARRLLFFGTLAAIPLAYERQMYGALFALPFVVLLAIQGILQLCQWWPAQTMAIFRTAIALTLIGAVSTVVHRSRLATPGDLRKAALFLEQVDPRGPFQVIAPGRARTQVQAYVSGCPRICVTPSTNMTVRLPMPPPGKGSARESLNRWISYGRGLFDISELKTSWYGDHPTTYYFVTGDQGSAPAGALPIYNENGITIYRGAER